MFIDLSNLAESKVNEKGYHLYNKIVYLSKKS